MFQFEREREFERVKSFTTNEVLRGRAKPCLWLVLSWDTDGEPSKGQCLNVRTAGSSVHIRSTCFLLPASSLGKPEFHFYLRRFPLWASLLPMCQLQSQTELSSGIDAMNPRLSKSYFYILFPRSLSFPI
jgi:hypothetical protein